MKPVKGCYKSPAWSRLFATAAMATMGEASAFKSGREFAAYVGLVPKQTGTGGNPVTGDKQTRGYLSVNAIYPWCPRRGVAGKNRNKTNQGDAKMISRYCALHTPTHWSPAPLSERQLTALMRRLNHLEEMKRMECNRKMVADEIVQPFLTESISALKKQIIEIKKKIKSHIDETPALKKNKQLLESIPGISEILSATLLACSSSNLT